MDTLTLYVPIESNTREFVGLVAKIREAGFRFQDLTVIGNIAAIYFERLEKEDERETAPVKG